MTAYCGCLGCRNEATTRISYDGRPMVICDFHADGQQEVLAN